jgi:transposase InsO family protein
LRAAVIGLAGHYGRYGDRRGRLGLADGSCIRLRPERPNHVWSWDFVMDRTDDGRPIKIMTLIDECTRECLAIHVARRIRTCDVIDILADVMQVRAVPEHRRSDNGPEMVAKVLRRWLEKLGTKCIYISPGSPWENGYRESFNGRLRDELLDGESLLHPQGGPAADRALAGLLQHPTTAQRPRLPTARTGNHAGQAAADGGIHSSLN